MMCQSTTVFISWFNHARLYRVAKDLKMLSNGSGMSLFTRWARVWFNRC
jgi:hypothetical protein